MLIQTKDLGSVDIREDAVIHFPKGIYGFEESRRFALLDTGSSSGVMHLQCVDNLTPRFIVLDPFALLEDYAPQIPADSTPPARPSPRELAPFLLPTHTAVTMSEV